MKKYNDSNKWNIKDVVNHILLQWLKFEKDIVKINTNTDYFRHTEDLDTGEIRQILNFDGYYKGKTINQQIADFQFEYPNSQ